MEEKNVLPEQEIWYKKILNFCKKNITTVYICISILIVLIYAFFFASPHFIGGVDESDLKFTKIGTVSEDELGKEFTLENWEYCDAEDKMIVEISIENLVFDNVNDYTYSAKVQEVNSDVKQLQTEVVYKDKNYNVIAINGVPDKMAVVRISLEYESVSNDDSSKTELYGVSFYTNMNNVSKVDHIVIKTKNGYDLARVERLITSLENQIKEKEDELSDLSLKSEDILDTINNYELSKDNATPSEQDEIDLKIKTCEDEYEDNEGKITDIEAEIDNLEIELSDAIGTRNTLAYKVSEEATESATTETATTVSSSSSNNKSSSSISASSSSKSSSSKSSSSSSSFSSKSSSSKSSSSSSSSSSKSSSSKSSSSSSSSSSKSSSSKSSSSSSSSSSSTSSSKEKTKD